MNLNLKDYLSVIRKHPYQNKGIFYSEIWHFLNFCYAADVDFIIESGTYHGFATDILSQAYCAPIITIDRQQLYHTEDPEQIQVLIGEAQELIPPILERQINNNIGILIDGPKGDKALVLKDQLMCYENVKVVAIHDLEPGHGESVHSHQLHESAKHLDRYVVGGYETKYPLGPGLAIWTKSAIQT